LSLEADVDPTLVSLLKRRGRRSTLAILCRLADVLGVSPSELVAAIEKVRRAARR
jgi:transcriptional regulator with XRE-family HTH domain